MAPIKIDPPYRRRQSTTIPLHAHADDVFALMCPVREYEWAPGWVTSSIISQSGLVEEDCIFVTPKGASSGGDDAIWITSHHDKEKRQLTMYKVVPNETVTRLDISIAEKTNRAEASVCYELTALSDAGKPFVDRHTEDAYRDMMTGWKNAIEANLARAA